MINWGRIPGFGSKETAGTVMPVPARKIRENRFSTPHLDRRKTRGERLHRHFRREKLVKEQFSKSFREDYLVRFRQTGKSNAKKWRIISHMKIALPERLRNELGLHISFSYLQEEEDMLPATTALPESVREETIFNRSTLPELIYSLRELQEEYVNLVHQLPRGESSPPSLSAIWFRSKFSGGVSWGSPPTGRGRFYNPRRETHVIPYTDI